MTDFSKISAYYQEKSLVQATAGKQLIELLAIPRDADILDVGCGTGNITAELRSLTSGRVVGIDPAEGMIQQAQKLHAGTGAEFHVLSGDRMPYCQEFDILFCNSAFQWFTQPSATLQKFRTALRSSGKVGMQAPATKNYCPEFIKAIDHCRRSKQIDDLFAGFHSPWFFLDSAKEYQVLFEQAGLRVISCHIEEVHQVCTVQKAVDVFSSGAAAGYLNQAYFSEPLPGDFHEQILRGVRESFQEQADLQGEIDLAFRRIFIVAQK